MFHEENDAITLSWCKAIALLVMMSPALENSLLLATNVAGIASRRRATLVTSLYDVTLAFYQRSGH